MKKHPISFVKKFPILTLAIGLVALILIQREFIMPLVYKVIKSDLFLVETQDQGSATPVSNSLTDLAFIHCNSYIKSELDSDMTINFPEKPINAWSLGGHQYVINAEVDITSDTSNTVTKRYVCRINYNNKDNEEGALDSANWSVYGLSGLDDI